MSKGRFNEIGGNFWLKPNQWNKRSEVLPRLTLVDWQKDIFFTSSGRGAIRLALKQDKIKGRRALLPIFTCESVIKPFLDYGFQTAYYEIEHDFSIDFGKLNKLIEEYKPSVLFLQSYFGFDNLAEIRTFIPQLRADHNLTIIEDITHSLLSDFRKQGADYYVASLRKWMELPDGGLVISTRDNIKIDEVTDYEDIEIVDLFIRASKLKYKYTKTMNLAFKIEFRKLFYNIEEILNNRTSINPISSVSKYILSDTNLETIKKARQQNYFNLLTETTNNKLIKPCFKKLPRCVTPLYFSIFMNGNRDLKQKQLAMKNIYAPILWPLPQCFKKAGFPIRVDLYENILCIPCDQRYEYHEMERIIKELTSFCFQ